MPILSRDVSEYMGIQRDMSSRIRGCCKRLGYVWLVSAMLLLPLSAKTFRVYVTNHAGDTVDVIDPAINRVVQRIQGLELPHDVNFSPDGNRVYISLESENVLAVVDKKSGNIIKKVPLSGRPNTIAVTKDGGRVFVGIHSDPGVLDVIDTSSLERLKSIPKTGPVHDIYLTPDGKFLVVGSEEVKLLSVLDVQTEKLTWNIKFDGAVRTMAFETNSDGSTHRIFVTVSPLHGFAVVDFAERKVVDKIELPNEPRRGKTATPGVPSHGIGVTPDNKTLWVNSSLADAVFAYSLPDLKLLGNVPTGMHPIWITFSPDSRIIYDSNTAENTVSVIDAKALKEVARIPVGQSPERNATLVLP